MESLLIREQYKVTCVLHAEKDYAALLAVDIRSRGKETRLLNVYEGEYRRRYVPCYHQLQGCRQFLGVFLWEESLIAVFDYRKGLSIDQVFFKGSDAGWEFRLKAAEDLFHQALVMADFPSEVSCAAMLSGNIQVFPEERTLSVNYVVRPMGEMNQRELVWLLTDQIEKILLLRWESPPRERELIRTLARREDRTVAAVYGRWNGAAPVIREEFRNMEEKGALSRFLYLLFLNGRDRLQLLLGKA